ncbi:urokinase plasminogen activator surface receptor-like protein [Labeo rohita]|uniref:Urokinase plasminogen activator surface receptor-like protein n=1 Tax=Labeo rohita TaxID=84645 RepID=A0A498NGS1_LABRO|nr:urokinase plasminogen activator surface receptor-like protein [Labeo rohita]
MPAQASSSINSKINVQACSLGCASGSLNLDIVKSSYFCCGTSFCNARNAQDPRTIVPNGNKCYSCDGKSCSNILSCSGTEDRCITGTGTFEGRTTVVKGCVSEGVCDTITFNSVHDISCCKGNLCNDDKGDTKSITQSFIQNITKSLMYNGDKRGAQDPSNVPNGKTCYSCDGKSCLNILSCSGSQDRCLKAAGSIKAKDCAVDCASGSMNVGTAKNSLVCCNTDKCNTQDAPDPANVPNGKTCYSCDGQSCSNILSCSGSEDLCFNGTGGTTAKAKVKDCAADCASGSINLGIGKNSLACCNTDQCNVQDAPDPSNVPNGKTCYSCDEKSCLNILSCSGTEDRCLKATVGITTTMKAKDCAADCASGSMNLGILKNSFACCNTDQCNVQDAPDPSNVPNGKTCYSCDEKSCSNILSCAGSEDRCLKATDPRTDSNGKKCYYCDGKSCSNILSCSGKEDHCITATGSFVDQSLVVKGCASKSICDATTSVTDVQTISCCEGNLCNNDANIGPQSANSAESVTQSFRFLCCFLLSFVLLH